MSPLAMNAGQQQRIRRKDMAKVYATNTCLKMKKAIGEGTGKEFATWKKVKKWMSCLITDTWNHASEYENAFYTALFI